MRTRMVKSSPPGLALSAKGDNVHKKGRTKPHGNTLLPDGRTEEVSPENGHDYQPEELHRLLDCSTIALVPTRDGNIMVTDDDGKISKKPCNEAATALVAFKSPAEIAQEMLRARAMGFGAIYINPDPPDMPDYIAGTVLVCESHEVE